MCKSFHRQEETTSWAFFINTNDVCRPRVGAAPHVASTANTRTRIASGGDLEVTTLTVRANLVDIAAGFTVTAMQRVGVGVDTRVVTFLESTATTLTDAHTIEARVFTSVAGGTAVVAIAQQIDASTINESQTWPANTVSINAVFARVTCRVGCSAVLGIASRIYAVASIEDQPLRAGARPRQTVADNVTLVIAAPAVVGVRRRIDALSTTGDRPLGTNAHTGDTVADTTGGTALTAVVHIG